MSFETKDEVREIKKGNEEEKSQKCWEYLNALYGKEICSAESRKTCRAVQAGLEDDCWFIPTNHCMASVGVVNCWDCPWFKHQNPYFPKRFGR